MKFLFINLNIATCWLMLKECEFVKRQYDVVMKLDLFNVESRFRRAHAYDVVMKLDLFNFQSHF